MYKYIVDMCRDKECRRYWIAGTTSLILLIVLNFLLVHVVEKEVENEIEEINNTVCYFNNSN